MGRTENSLVPQWLKSRRSVTSGGRISNQLTSSSHGDQINYSSVRSAISNGYGRSRSGRGFDRNQPDRDWKKDTDNFFNKGKVNRGGRKQLDHSKSMNNTMSNRFEKDLLQHSKSMTSGTKFPTWSHRNMVDLSDAKSNHDMHKTTSEEEFPLLGAEERQGGSDMGRVLSSSSSSSPATHKLLTGKSTVIFSNDLLSPLHGTPVTVGSSTVSGLCQHTVSACSSSIAPSMMGLNMAETLAQAPPRSLSPPQSSVDEQRLKELAIKQSRLLIPVTPSMPRALVVSPLEKSKVKTGQQHPFSSPRPTNHSVRGGPTKSDVLTTSSGNSRLVSASRELKGLSSATKVNVGPSGSGLVTSPIGATKTTSMSATSSSSSNNSKPAVRTTLERRPSFQAQSRSEFFKNLSRKSALKNPSSDVCASGMQFTSESEVVTGNGTASPTLQSSDSTFVDTSAANSLMVSSSILTDNGNAGGEPLKLSNNGQQHLSTNPNLFSDEEEAAFLRSLGWEENAGEDEGLTEEEIQDFYEKCMKLQPSANILHNLHLKVVSDSCGGAYLD